VRRKCVEQVCENARGERTPRVRAGAAVSDGARCAQFITMIRLMSGSDPDRWTSELALCLNLSQLHSIAHHSRVYVHDTTWRALCAHVPR
jgi:hypothetical protein